MLRSVSSTLGLKTLVLATAILAYPCTSFAQHGGGGGHIGGSAAGGGGLSSGNRASGVENKDDLRDFHEIMAVQASNEQKAAYAAMVKSTAAASAQLQGFVALLDKQNNASEIAQRDKSFADAIETARTLNKKFLEGFSEPQKSGLKEITKRLAKADSELAQQARSLDQQVEVNAASAQMAGTARSVEGALTGFQREQADLGDEMSISSSNAASDVAFNIPTVKNKVNFADQAFIITTSGTISKPVAAAGQNSLAMELTADMSDLQQTITDLLHAKLDTSDRCGERITLQTADSHPAGTRQPGGCATPLRALDVCHNVWQGEHERNRRRQRDHRSEADSGRCRRRQLAPVSKNRPHRCRRTDRRFAAFRRVGQCAARQNLRRGFIYIAAGCRLQDRAAGGRAELCDAAAGEVSGYGIRQVARGVRWRHSSFERESNCSNSRIAGAIVAVRGRTPRTDGPLEGLFETCLW